MKRQNLISNFWTDTHLLNRIVFLTLGAVVLVVVSFGGYYYWDRYVHLGDPSPLALGVAALEEKVREDPQDPEVRVALAQYYYENGIYDKAITQAQQVLENYPKHEGALFVLGLAYTGSGNVEAAIEPLEQFVTIRREAEMASTDSLLETALYFLGENYVELHRPSEAIAILSEALVINRIDADAMYQLGLAYAMDEKPELALEQYHNAVRFVPDFFEAYSAMAESYRMLSMPSHVDYARGMETFAQGDYAQARKYLEKAVKNLPDFVPALVGMGLTYESLGDLQSAQTNLEQALLLEPDNFMASHALARVQMSLNDNQP